MKVSNELKQKAIAAFKKGDKDVELGGIMCGRILVSKILNGRLEIQTNYAKGLNLEEYKNYPYIPSLKIKKESEFSCVEIPLIFEEFVELATPFIDKESSKDVIKSVAAEKLLDEFLK